MSWPLVSLESLLEIKKGKKHEPCEIPSKLTRRFLQIDDLRNDSKIKYTLDKKGVFADKTDVIIAWDGANAGTIGFGKEGLIGSTLAKLSFDLEQVNTEYLGRFLQSKFRELRENCTGATIPHISKPFLVSLKIPLPPLETQKQIAAVLEKADQLRKDCKLMEQELNSLAQSVFIDMFGDPVTNPKGWEVKNIGSTFSTLTDYHANGSYEVLQQNVELLDEGFALMVRTTDLEKNNFVDGVKYISEHAYNYLKKTKVYGGELIVNKIGSAGKLYLMPVLNRPVSLAMNQFMVRFNQEKVLPVFMYHLLSTQGGENAIQKKVKGAVTKTIRKDALREIKMPIPPIKKQQEFCKILSEQTLLLKENIELKVQFENAFNSLMQKVFKGELKLEAVA